MVHLAALSNDPLGDLRPRARRMRSTSTARSRSPGRRKDAEWGASSSPRRVRRTGPPAPTSPRRVRAASSVDPVAESKVRSEDALHELADGDFSPIYLRNATAYGVSPRLRLDVVLIHLRAWAIQRGRFASPIGRLCGRRSCTCRICSGGAGDARSATRDRSRSGLQPRLRGTERADPRPRGDSS